MSEMVERVARAMAAVVGENFDAQNFNETLNGDDPDEMRGYWTDMARAAIEAMREPTVEMIVLALPETDRGDDPDMNRLAERALFVLEEGESDPEDHLMGRIAAQEMIRDWRNMIDAALSETPEHE